MSSWKRRLGTWQKKVKNDSAISKLVKKNTTVNRDETRNLTNYLARTKKLQENFTSNWRSMAYRFNYYKCTADPRHIIFTVDVAVGVTPFCIGCPICDKDSHSGLYPRTALPNRVHHPDFEFYRKSENEDPNSEPLSIRLFQTPQEQWIKHREVII